MLALTGSLTRCVLPAAAVSLLQITSSAGALLSHTPQQAGLPHSRGSLLQSLEHLGSCSYSTGSNNKQRKQQRQAAKPQQDKPQQAEQQPQPQQQPKQPQDASQQVKQLQEELQKLQEQIQQQQKQEPGADKASNGTADDAEQPLEGPNGTLWEWRVESAAWYSNMFHHAVDANLAHPQGSTWSELHRAQPSNNLIGLLKRLVVPDGSSNLRWPLQRMYARHSLIAEFLLTHAHQDFDAEAFKQGVQQALEYSTELYAASDFVTLKPLVSEALLRSMRQAREQQAESMEADGVTVSDVELQIDPDSVRLVSASALTREQLSGLDQQRARDTLPLIPVGADDEESATVDPDASAAAGAASSATASPVAEGAADAVCWDVAHVYAEGVLHTQVSRGGQAAQAVQLRKRGHYLLCRGPLHIDRVLTTAHAEHTPWFLLAWM